MARRELSRCGSGRDETTIRPALPADAAALARLARSTYEIAFGLSLSQPDLESHLARHLSDARVARFIDDGVVLLAERNGRLVGFAQVTGGDRTCTLERLYVDPEVQNQGIGTALMEAVLAEPRVAHAASVTLDVWEHNTAAQRFYRRFGFDVVGSRTFEVASGAATSLDLIMTRAGPQGSG